MADTTVRGRFVWHELATPDTSGAHTFYSQALGWQSEGWEQDPSYRMFVAPSGPLGGTTPADGRASSWLPFVGTLDIDATIAHATRLGGAVMKPPTTIANGSKYALLTDPQGAAFAIYSPAGDPGPDNAPAYGDFSWHELATTDNRAAFDFYSALFGWEKLDEFDMGTMGVYIIYGRNGAQLGGIFNKGDLGMPGCYWVGYVRVKDVPAAAKQVKAAGGTVVNGPMEVPGGHWIAQCLDPSGALFAVHALAQDMRAAAKAAPKPPARAAAGKASAPKKKPAKKKRTAARKAPKRARAAVKKKAKKKTKKKTQRKTAKKSAPRKKKKIAARTAKKKRRAGKARGAKRARKRR